MSKLTLSMIVKDEEKYLRKCLESVQDVVDEIVIVDTGSTDKTLEIAKRFNSKIYHFDWIKDFSAARNFALSKSTGDWILYLDADERLSVKSQKELIAKISSNQKKGINCTINNLDDYNDNPKLMKYTRLFKRSLEIGFVGKAHEQIEASLLENGYQIEDSNIEIIHEGYNVPKDELMVKAERNLELLLNDYKIKPTSYLAFQIGNSYSVLDEIEESVKYYEKALKDKSLRVEFKSVCYLNISDYLMRTGNLEEAKKNIDIALKSENEHPQLNMVGAQIYDFLNDGEKALKLCEISYRSNQKLKKKNSIKALDTIINDENILLEGILISLRNNSGEMLNYFMNELEKCNSEFYYILNSVVYNKLSEKDNLLILISYINEKNFEAILKIIKYNSNIDKKLEFYSNIYDKFAQNPIYLREFGLFLFTINQLSEAKIIFEQALQFKDFDESIIFYLASIYVNQNEVENLKKLIKSAETKENKSTIFISKLNLLKEKLDPLLHLT